MRIVPMFPEMRAQPCAAGGPQSVLGAIDRCRRAPQIDIVVRDPAARAVHRPCGACAGLGDLADHLDERRDAFGEVGRMRRPIVHLGIDVDRVFGAPGRLQALVPQPLQRRGLAARLRAGDQQITRILKVERGERRIGGGIVGGDALVGRQVGGGRAAEIDRDAAKQAAVRGAGVGGDAFEGLAARACDRRGGERLGIAGHVVVATIAGRHRDQQRRAGGAAQDELVALGREGAAFGEHGEPRGEAEAGGFGLLGGVGAGHQQRGHAIRADHGALLRRSETDRHVERARLRHAEPDRDHVARGRGDHLAAMRHAVRDEVGFSERRIEVERPAIVLGLAYAGEVEQQIAQRLV